MDGTDLIYRNLADENYATQLASEWRKDEIIDIRTWYDFLKSVNEATAIHRYTAPDEYSAKATYNHTHCVAISTNLLNAGKWILINCHEKMDAWVMCQGSLEKNNTKSRMLPRHEWECNSGRCRSDQYC